MTNHPVNQWNPMEKSKDSWTKI